MIYVSSSCIKAKTIREAIEKLANAGYKNIELSGGTQPYSDLYSDLKYFKNQGFSFLCHNYFPPPDTPFVINLASLDPVVFEFTLDHLRKSIALSKELESLKFAFHAGFLINIPTQQIGQSISQSVLFDRVKAMKKFIEGFKQLSIEAGEVELYLENNVLSSENYRNFGNSNPFFLVDLDDYIEMHQEFPFRLLLDTGHLKVSCHTLGLDFISQLEKLLVLTDYIHISDNDALTDSNKALVKNSEMFNLLRRFGIKNKTITLEVYGGMEALKESFDNVSGLIA